MESRRKRSRGQIVKWICYALLGLLCAVLQTTPGLFQFGAAKPLWLLPLALAVAVFEGEFAGAVFGAVCGLMWDWLAGRTVGIAGAGAAAALLCRFGGDAALLQEFGRKLCAHCVCCRPAGAHAGLAVFLLHARLQRRGQPLAVVRAAHGGALGARLLPSVRGRAPHPRRI